MSQVFKLYARRYEIDRRDTVTLFEGDYHLGAAALINPLCAAGFDETVVCGHRGPVPPWALAAHPHEIP